MKAMVLAAGLGTRLRPLTDHLPKALVEVAGHTLLEMALARLRSLGVRDVIVNAHHHAAMIEDYLAAHDNFGLRIAVSREDTLLDTGGGLRKAAPFFLEQGGDEPFVVHNVDVISTIDLAAMVKFHVESSALATLAVQDRKTSRHLLFDEQGQLCGRSAGQDGTDELVTPVAAPRALAFAGIHVISPRIFSRLTEVGAFSIINAYLRLAGQGESIIACLAGSCQWRDLGTPGSIAQAAEEIRSGRFQPVLPISR